MANGNLLDIVGGGGKVTSGFGPRETNIKGASDPHKGNDLVSASNIANAPVYARYDGVIAKVGTGTGFGNYVLIEYKQPDGAVFYAINAHLSKTIDKSMEGKSISSGDYVGNIGHTTNSKLVVNDHLHYEERFINGKVSGDPYQAFIDKGVPVDPKEGYISIYRDNILQNTEITDPTTLNLSPTTSTTNKFGGETLSDLVKRLQTEDAAQKASSQNTTNHTDNTSKDTTSTNNTSSDKSQTCTETLPKSDLDLKGEANITTEKLASNGSMIAQTYDSEGNLTNAVVLSSNSKSELFFSNGEILSSKTTQTDGIVSTKEYSNGIVSSELIQNGDATTNVAYSNGAPFIATTTNQTDSTITNTIYSNDGKSISARTLEQSDGTVMSQSFDSNGKLDSASMSTPDGNSIMKVFDTETGDVKIITQTSIDKLGNETTTSINFDTKTKTIYSGDGQVDTPLDEGTIKQYQAYITPVSYDGSDAPIQYADYNPSDISVATDAQKQVLADYFRANNISGDEILANTIYNPLTGRLVYNDPEKGGISVDASGSVMDGDSYLSDAQTLLDLYNQSQNDPAIDTTKLDHYTDAGNIKTDGTTSSATNNNDTPTTQTSNPLSSNLTPSQYSSLANFMSASGQTDLTQVNMGNSTIFKDLDGNIVGELYIDDSGIAKYTDSQGNSTYITDNGKTLTQEQYTQYQWGQASEALSLANSFIGLQNWSNETNLQKAATTATIYNQIDHLGGADNLPGEFGSAVAGLGLANAIQSGDTVGIVTNGLMFADAVADGAINAAAQEAIGAEIPVIGVVVGVINTINALENGDTAGAVTSALATAALFIPVYGVFISLAITIIGSLFGGSKQEDLPMHEGHAHAAWDENANISVVTDQDSHNGGGTANSWMSGMLSTIQSYLASQTDSSGAPLYELIPQRLPSIGYQYDPDGFNYASAAGHLYLTWTDESGVSQTRYYNGQGSRMDGTSSEGMSDLMRDFAEHTQDAIVPRWEAQTIKAHYLATLATEGKEAADAEAAIINESQTASISQDGRSQSIEALTAELLSSSLFPTSLSSSNALLDIDNDGYLEKTQWVAPNIGVLTIDTNYDSIVGGDEILNTSNGDYINSVHWLDINNDGVLNASDPAFSAIKLWLDVNSDGSSISQGMNELYSMDALGITAIDFRGATPTLIFSDGSTKAMNIQTLTGDIEGIKYKQTNGGALEIGEDGHTLLHAVNTREFDGQAEHTHGGDIDLSNDDELVDVKDKRLVSYKVNTIANTLSQEIKKVTKDMIASAENANVFAAALPLFAVGVASAGESVNIALVGSNEEINTPQTTHTVSLSELTSLPTSDTQISADTFRISVAELLSKSSIDASTNTPTFATTATQNITIASVGESFGGSVRIEKNEVVFEKDAGYIGKPSFSYTLQDTDQKLYSGEFSPINYAPITMLDNVTLDEDTPIKISIADLLSNDYDLDGLQSNITFLGVSEVKGGEVRVENGYIYFSPFHDYFGEASFKYSVSDAYGAVTIQDVSMHINAVNDIPVVAGESMTTDEDTILYFSIADLLSNDYDVDNASLAISSVFDVENGTVRIEGDKVVFTPDADYFGEASFVYTVDDGVGGSATGKVDIYLNSVNDAPRLIAESAATDEDTVLSFDIASLMSNDYDVDNQFSELSFTGVSNAKNGTATVVGDKVIFTPDADYFGEASFDYSVSDGVGGVGTTTVAIDLAPVNDAPRLQSETTVTDEDTILRFSFADLLANDYDVDNEHSELTISNVKSPSNGTVSIDNDANEVVFTPNANYFGPAGFVYTVEDGVGGASDARVDITYNSVNDLPVANDELIWGKRNFGYTVTTTALLSNDTDVENPHALSITGISDIQHGTAVFNGSTVRFTPDADFAGRGSFKYTVRDLDGGESVAQTEIDFSHINVNPVAVDDGFLGFENTPFSISQAQLMVNDYDPDAWQFSSLSVDAVGSASNGSVYMDGGSNVVFVPNSEFEGTASFAYRLNDGEGGVVWATAYLNVQHVNKPPVITSVFYDTSPDATNNEEGNYLYGTTYDDPYRQKGSISAYDPEGGSVTYSIASGPVHGHAWANQYVKASTAGSITYDQVESYKWVSEAGAWQYFSHYGDPYSGGDSFVIRATDSEGAYTDTTVTANHVGTSVGGGGGKKPVTLDLSGNGLQFTNIDDASVYFDVNDDGWREHIAWVSPEDGLLALDIDGDRIIKSIDEISFVGYKEGARTDLEGLQAFDSNHDGTLSKLDERWGEFGVWQDKNSNGSTETGEFAYLSETDIASISLKSDEKQEIIGDVTLLGKASYETTGGDVHEVGDVAFKYDETDKKPSSEQAAANSGKDNTTIKSEVTETTEKTQVETQAVAATDTAVDVGADTQNAKLAQAVAVFVEATATQLSDSAAVAYIPPATETTAYLQAPMPEAAPSELDNKNGATL